MPDRCILLTYFALVTITVIALLVPRKKKQRTGETKFRGLGVRIIQFLTVVCIVPAIVVLRLYDKISSDAVMTLLGTVIGFVLSNIKEFRNRRSPAPPPAPVPPARIEPANLTADTPPDGK
jgi:hypothetical protein